MTFIDRCGLEIEGCWAGEPGFSPLAFPLKQDISVHRIGDYAHYGEAATVEPIRRDEVAAWLKTNWPAAADTRCGLHAHASVLDPKKNYGRLACRAFFDTLLAKLEEWGRKNIPNKDDIYWHRLGVHGESQLNRFCSRIFDPTTQMKMKDKSDNKRRSILNYCYDMHGTLECRVYPVFTQGPEMAASAVDVFFQTIEDFLSEVEEQEKEGLIIPVSFRKKVVVPPMKKKTRVLFGNGPSVPQLNPHATWGAQSVADAVVTSLIN